ncbi:MAG: lamin tail domain-containing protein, partial [Verrucomicrobiales bacterium]
MRPPTRTPDRMLPEEGYDRQPPIVCVGWLTVLAALVLTTVHLEAQVVVSEIMYHPGHLAGTPENRSLEFIELHNTNTEAEIDISGWGFSEGVAFEFSDGTTIPAGGHLVVASDPASYPEVPNLAGPWVGRLSNSGERITLTGAGGEIIDSLKYYDEGEWASKVRDPSGPGWQWVTLADGGGHSLELISSTTPNGYGTNWGDSEAPGGTPGGANSIAADTIAPIVTGVQHSPAVPRSDEPITVTARIVSAAPAEDLTVIAQMRLPSEAPSGDDAINLITGQTQFRTLVPSGPSGPEWREPGFNDSQWTSGVRGIGYERSS